ncbi:MAG: endolytic transglycosylase MltG [Actinomycetia bacterium]|nr:endolytic transglycosylase MltG [Actinomycetes bacterium]
MTDYEPEDGYHTESASERTQVAPVLSSETRPVGHRRMRKKKRGPGCMIALIIVLVLGAAGYWGVNKAVSMLDGVLGPPDNYSGNGTGKVVVEVGQGDPIAEIGRTLKAEGVVASVDAFTDAAAQNPESGTIQPGFYKMANEMSAEAALGRLLDESFRTSGSVIVPEGLRSDQIPKVVAEGSEIDASAVKKALKKPEKLGLPAYAEGEVEGFLYPATYEVAPKASATELLRQMVKNAREAHNELRLNSRAAKVGVSAREALIVASLIEREASRDKDRPKVARVIYNRLDEGMPLQLDSTVHYVAERSGDVFTTDEERDIDSPYNTYKSKGLPPGPIDSPGEEAIKAALNPAKGSWTYFVTVDLESGETLFASSLSGHNKNVEKLQKYCEGSDLC